VPRISVIVPVRHDTRLDACLAALGRQTLPRDRFEVIVADDGPDPAVLSLAARHGVRCVSTPAAGSYAARSAAVAVAAGEVLAFTDADCVPPPTWLETIDGLLADGEVEVVVGPSRSVHDGVVSAWVQAVDEGRWSRLDPAATAFCDTRNLAIRRRVYDTTPFDTSFRYAGDLDLGLRLHAAGIRIRPSPELRLGHDHPHDLAAVLRRAVRRGRGLAALDRKHRPGGGSGRASAGTLGERPLRIGPVDVKRVVLVAARHPVGRAALLPPVAAGIAATSALLAILARLPAGRRAGVRPFTVFERLGLLLGRVIGPVR
jgi:glycosyltransferase involved in cell wall biosynthesis